MSFVDRELVCLDCAQAFVFTAGEQDFYERKGFKEEPKRCKPCREQRKQRRNDAPVTPRAPRAANGAANGAGHGGYAGANGAAAGNTGGFGFRGGDDEAQPDLDESNGNRAYSDDVEDDSIGNRAPGTPSRAPQRPQAAAPRAANGGGGARRERSPGAGAAAGGERRDLHDATCAQCNGVARVPFKPVPGRPVYCRDCYASRAASAGGR